MLFQYRQHYKTFLQKKPTMLISAIVTNTPIGLCFKIVPNIISGQYEKIFIKIRRSRICLYHLRNPFFLPHTDKRFEGGLLLRCPIL